MKFGVAHIAVAASLMPFTSLAFAQEGATGGGIDISGATEMLTSMPGMIGAVGALTLTGVAAITVWRYLKAASV